jgi:hypothetical protein
MGLRVWHDRDTGEIVGWPGNENFLGKRTYAFPGTLTEEDLEGAKVIHHRGADAVLKLADGTTLREAFGRKPPDDDLHASLWSSISVDDGHRPDGTIVEPEY